MTADLRAAWVNAMADAETAAQKAWENAVPEGMTPPTPEQWAKAKETEVAWARAEERAVAAFRALFNHEVRINKDGVAERKI
jgi:NADPH-dependent ferric siderophore reductase